MSYVFNSNYSGKVIVYPDQVPFDTDVLRTNTYRQVDVALLAQAILGKPATIGGSFVGLASGICTADSPADLAVDIGLCSIYQLVQMEPLTYGNIGPLTTPLIYKQFVNMIAIPNFGLGTITAPGGGLEQYYLVQGTPTTSQINSVNRPYYNASNPSSPNFNSADDTEIDEIVFSLVAGTPAATGTATIPTPTGSAIGMFVLYVAHGQTTIANGNISYYSGSFIPETLNQKISQATADARYVQISNEIAPNVTTLTAGSGTYTTPAGALYLKVRAVGPGGGGGGGGTSSTTGSDGSAATTFGTALISAGAGAGAVAAASGNAAGGTATGGTTLNVNGGTGQGPGLFPAATGGMGGDSELGGAGAGGGYSGGGAAAAAGSGSGGGGGGGSISNGSGGGGGSGGYCESIIATPAATYLYVVGVGGAQGGAGSGGFAGGPGADGVIVVEAYFQ